MLGDGPCTPLALVGWPAVLLFSGCFLFAPNLKLKLSYVPAERVNPIAGARAINVAIRVDDRRTRQRDIGTITSVGKQGPIVSRDSIQEKS